jgi:small-conductance mechanosensitive channel
MKHIIYTYLLLFSFYAFSQNQNTVEDKILSESIKTDSIFKSKASQKAINLIYKVDSLQKADSINKVVLQRQIENLKSYEKKKREGLEKELSILKTKEEDRQLNLAKELEKLKRKAIGYPIIIHKDTLFQVFTNAGPISAKERARIVSERLHTLYKSYNPQKDSLVIFEKGHSTEMFFKDQIILSVSELDELWFKQDKSEIIGNYKTSIEKDIVVFKSDVSFFKKLKKLLLSLLTLIVLFAIIKAINYLFKNKIIVILDENKNRWLRGVKFKNYQIIDTEKQYSYVLYFLKIIRYAFILLFCYIAFPVVFSIFPETQRYAILLISYITTPVKSIVSSFISFLPNLLTIIVIITITNYFLKFLKFLAKEIEQEKIILPGFYPDWSKSTYNILKILVFAFMLIVIFPYLPGSESNVFKGVSVFIGIMFSLGSSSVISNLVAGLVITYMRPFKIGDRIKINDISGEVMEKTPFVIRVKTAKQVFITIPNSNVLATNVVNYSSSNNSGGVVLFTTITIGYDVSWRKVHELLIEAANKVDNIKLTPKPFVLQTSLDDFYVSYQLNFFTDKPLFEPKILNEIHQNIQDLFNENEIEILSPHYRADRDGNTMAVPEEYLPKDYVKPGFNINLKK